MTTFEKQQRLRRKLSEAGLLDSPDSVAGDRVQPGTDDGPGELSSAQRRMWYHQQLAEDSTAYNFCLVLRLREPVAAGEFAAAFTRALGRAVHRHAIFRTTYHAGRDGDPYQVIHPELPPGTSWADAGEVGTDELAAVVDDLARRAQHTPFDLAADAPLRALFVRQHDTVAAVVLTLPHIAGDGGSFRTFLRDLERYLIGAAGEPDEPGGRVRYLDYARWQARHLGAPEDPASRHATQLAFWERELADLPVELDLPVDRPRPSRPTFEGAQHRVWLPAGLGAAVSALAQRHRASPLVVLQTAVAAALGQSTGEQVVPLGTPVDLRSDSALSDVVGFFSNTVVLRTDLRGDPTFGELLARAQQASLAALDHRDVPFEQVVERLNPPRSLARNPLFQVMIAATRPWPEMRLGAVTASAAEPTQTQAKFDLTFAVHEYGGGGPIGVSVLYSCELFNADTARQLLERVTGVLGQTAFHPGLRLSELAGFRYRTLSEPAAALAGTLARRPHPPRTARTARTVRLAPGTGADRVAAALYGMLAAHDALRLRADGDTWRLDDAAHLLEHPVLSTEDTGAHPAGPQRFTALLHGAGGPSPTLELSAPGTFVDEESWIALLAGLDGIRDTAAGHRLPAPGAYGDYLDRTARLAADPELADHAESWLELFDRAAQRPETADGTARPETGDGTVLQPEAAAGGSPSARRRRTVALPERARALDPVTLRTAVLAAAWWALPAEHDLLVEVDEPDRDRGGQRGGVGRFRRAFPVLLPGGAGRSTVDEPGLLAAVREVTAPVDAVRAASYGLARDASPHTVGALDDAPAPDVRLALSVTDPGTATDGDPTQDAPDVSDSPVSDHGPDGVATMDARFEFDGRTARVVLTAGDATLDRWAGAVHACVSAVAHEPDTGPDTASGPDTAPGEPLVVLSEFERHRLQDTFGPLREVLPLSPLQEGLLFHLMTAGEGGDVYISQTTLDLAGTLDADRMRLAAAEAVRRCPTIAAGFTELGDRLVQVVPEHVELPWRRLDLTGLDPAEAEVAARGFADEEYRAGFDPAHPPMARFGLVSLSPREHRLLFTAHHILVDGWSIRLLLTLVLRLYTDPGAVRAPRPFRDFLDWLRHQDTTAAESAWQGVLDGAQPTLLAEQVPGVTATAARTGEQSRVLPAGLAERVGALARDASTTASTVFELAWATLLMRMTGSSDVVFGTVVSGRPAELDGVEGMVGLLFNTVPARVHTRPGDSVLDALTALHRQKSVHLRHSHLSLSQLLQLAGHPALFDTLFVVQNLPRQSPEERFGPDGALRRTAAGVRDATHYPLSMAVTPEDGRVTLRLMYRSDVFSDADIDALFDRYLRCLERFAESPRRALHRVEVLAEPEQRRLLLAGNDTAAPLPELSVSGLLHRQAGATPDTRAVVAGAVELSFAELDAAANRLGRLLLARGVGPEHRVALLLPRSELMVQALFGVFAAHAAYLPIDEETPAGRIRAMLDQAAPSAILTTGEYAALLPEEYASDARVVLLDTEAVRAELAGQPGTAPEPHAPRGLDHLAYVIFTSGSTGASKGVAVGYRGLTNMFVNHQQEIFGPVLAAQRGRRLRIAHTTSFSFDASWEQLLWLLAGHEVHVIDDEMRRDPQRLLDYFDRHRIDAFDVTPTYGQYLVEQGLLRRPRPRGEQDGTGVVFVSLGGEAVGEALWTGLRDAPGVGGYNLYGPTEYTINALGADVQDSPTPTVGTPIRNTRAYILGDGMLPAPAGVAGELYLAGVGLARGYVGSAGLTAARFVANPFGGPGERMYRTGDLARRRHDGGIDYLGRSDSQLKIRGYRVEPAEIENALVAHGSVAQAAVIGVTGEGGTTLAGYVVPATEPATEPSTESLDIAALHEHLSTVLPSYMIPAAIVPVPRLPLTVSGKLDVAALPEPVAAGAEERSPARTPAEQAVCDVFAELLPAATVGRDDDFFALGGHSLLVVRLVGRLRELFGTAISVRQVYDGPTPAALARIGAEDGEQPDGGGPSGNQHSGDQHGGDQHSGDRRDGIAARLAADAVLDPDISAAGRRPPRPGASTEPRAVLLTGASGFLGSFLLAELLDRTPARVCCLVRADGEEAAARRLRETLAGYRLWRDEFAGRIVVVPGDLEQPGLGLGGPWYDRLAEDVEMIVHNGAKVNDVEPYDRLAPTNVAGAREVLRLASTGTVKPVHFVSTASVLVRKQGNPPVIPEDTRLGPEEVSTNGYVSSKWVAEELMRAAADRGIPTGIYRPGRVSGHSGTGACSTGIGFWYFIRAMLLLGAAPRLHSDRITLAPVDYVAGAVVRLATTPGAPAAPGVAYHLVNEQPVSIADILDSLRAHGYDLPVVEFERWRDRLERVAGEQAERGDHSLSQAVLLAEHYAKYVGEQRESRLGQERTLAGLAGSGLRCPPVTAEVLARYVRYFADVGFFPPPRHPARHSSGQHPAQPEGERG